MDSQCQAGPTPKPRRRWFPPLYRWPFYGRVYRGLSLLLHRFNLHYMSPMGPFEDGSRQLWCKWCGARHHIPSETETSRRLRKLSKQIAAKSSAIRNTTMTTPPLPEQP
jgi:hypothetical protein